MGIEKNIRLPNSLTLTTCVWGREFLNLFENITLPALILPESLSALKETDYEVNFVIFTINDDYHLSALKSSKALKILSTNIDNIEIRYINEEVKSIVGIGHVYETMTLCHKIIADEAGASNGAIMFLNADTIYSQNTISFIISKLGEGYRTIELITPRASMEQVTPILENIKKDDVISLSKYDLNKLCFQNAHIITKNRFWAESEGKTICPDNLYWKVEEGVIARCTHFHPLIVYPKCVAEFSGTIDHDFIHNAQIKPIERYQICNGEIAGMEISADYHSQQMLPFTCGSTYDLVVYIQSMCGDDNIRNLLHNTVYLPFKSNISKEKYNRVRKEADLLVQSVLDDCFADYHSRPLKKTVKNASRFRVVIPLWGQDYIKTFCAGPAFFLLRPGNLDFLDDHSVLDIVFMTTRAGKENLLTELSELRILQNFTVQLIYIDDLLAYHHYGIVLTLAYVRAITDMGKQQCSTQFIFLNSDFIISDGAFRKVFDLVNQGYEVVLAPSLRCNEENITTDIDNILSLNSDQIPNNRLLVKTALNNLHLTVEASVCNQKLLTHDAQNQVYFKGSPEVMHCRMFLMFMLSFRPKRQICSVNGFIDYWLVAEEANEGKIYYVQDSDDIFLLEPSPTTQEGEYCTIGTPNPKSTAKLLEKWCNAYHLENGKKSIIIHSSDLSDVNLRGKKYLDEYMEKVYENIKDIKEINFHDYWKGCLNHHSFRLPYDEDFGFVPLKKSKAKMIFEGIFGSPPNVSIFDPEYSDWKALNKILLAVKKYHDVLVVRDSIKFDQLIKCIEGNKRVISFTELRNFVNVTVDMCRYECVIVLLDDFAAQLHNLRPMFESINNVLGQNGEAIFAIQIKPLVNDGYDFILKHDIMPSDDDDLKSLLLNMTPISHVYGEKRLSLKRQFYHAYRACLDGVNNKNFVKMGANVFLLLLRIARMNYLDMRSKYNSSASFYFTTIVGRLTAQSINKTLWEKQSNSQIVLAQSRKIQLDNGIS
jgi:hypothetical protein